jgi:hypothetical protein
VERKAETRPTPNGLVARNVRAAKTLSTFRLNRRFLGFRFASPQALAEDVEPAQRVNAFATSIARSRVYLTGILTRQLA